MSSCSSPTPTNDGARGTLQLTRKVIEVERPEAASLITPSVTLVGEPARRLIELAQLRGVGVAELLEELAAMALFDAAASGFGAAPARTRERRPRTP